MGIGLILEGGGMRGAYTAGVLDCFLDHKIAFYSVYGVSAGACHACSYLSGQRGRAIRTITDFVRDKHYAGVYSLLTTGDFFGAKLIYDDVPNHLLPFDYDAYLRGGVPFYVVLTRLDTGEACYLPAVDLRRDMLLIRASSSLPLLSKPVLIGGHRYLDGGVSDSIPLAKSIADGNKKNLVILTRHEGYVKEPSSFSSLTRRRYRKYPAFVDAMATRHIRYNQALDLAQSEAESGNALLIRPKGPIKIGRLERNPDKLRALYRQGYDQAEAMREKIRAFLE